MNEIDTTEKSINGWYVPVDPYADREYRYKRQTNYNIGYAFKVYLCPTCNRVHESAWEYGTGEQIFFYEEFPKFKLKKNVCGLCDRSDSIEDDG